ncbi:MAG: hypothetical protein E7546_03685 [Ruminococcaceae bacterium]|nr:hypothetical protein [Oscillospiraceae bacterium]
MIAVPDGEDGGDTMSPKELQYIEDALGHEKYLITQCTFAAERLEDDTLRQEAKKLCEKHQRIFNSLYSLV